MFSTEEVLLNVESLLSDYRAQFSSQHFELISIYFYWQSLLFIKRQRLEHQYIQALNVGTSSTIRTILDLDRYPELQQQKVDSGINSLMQIQSEAFQNNQVLREILEYAIAKDLNQNTYTGESLTFRQDVEKYIDEHLDHNKLLDEVRLKAGVEHLPKAVEVYSVLVQVSSKTSYELEKTTLLVDILQSLVTMVLPDCKDFRYFVSEIEPNSVCRYCGKPIHIKDTKRFFCKKNENRTCYYNRTKRVKEAIPLNGNCMNCGVLTYKGIVKGGNLFCSLKCYSTFRKRKYRLKTSL